MTNYTIRGKKVTNAKGAKIARARHSQPPIRLASRKPKSIPYPDLPMPIIAPPNSNRSPRIVVPGGIGDIYWIMTKMEAFCRREGITGKPQIVLLADDGIWEASRIRSIPYIEMIPFVTMADPQTVQVDPVKPRPRCLNEIYDEVSVKFGRSIIPDFMGYEYFMCYNGLINTGHWLEKDDDLECNWYFPLTISDEQEQYTLECQGAYGKYAVFYFSLYGDFVTRNMAQFSLEKMAEGIRQITTQCGLTPVFIGAYWDLEWPIPHKWPNYLKQLMDAIPGAVNLVGKTTLDQAFGIMRGADLIAGYHCGLTNMGIVFKKPTVLLWATDRFPNETSLAVAPPDTRMTSYIPLYTKDLTVDTFVGAMKDAYAQADQS